MVSCWAQPAQLHPWYKLATLKRKLPTMLPRLGSPSPPDGDDLDSGVKRQRRITVDQTHSKKRKLPSPPQSPIQESGNPPLFKRQRCTTLERSIERLSLTPPTQAAPQAPFHECTGRPSVPVYAAPVLYAPGFSSSQWLGTAIPTSGSSYPTSSPPPPLPPFASIPVTASAYAHMPALVADADGVTDIKMRTSSWYEPEKDRIIVTDLDTSSDDETDIVDDAPKLPRSVLLALLRGPKRDYPRPLEFSPVPPQLPSQSLDLQSLPGLRPASLSGPLLDEHMDIEQ
ncbi:hypothetical protein F5148DRAFT_1205062 [Russula earlei]|uniref:Uncharacterized protein n=1 Tax=Russula earlei TaxID=71964 RepID=A0ACC0U7Y5_9AGAM|nr:hypothetical protein F5148DRAFT_1205062 [Russula earlei]